jgi:hypothetical protein
MRTGWVLALALTASIPAQPTGTQPGPRSPLAATDTAIFSVAADGRTVLARAADLSTSWKAIATVPGGVGGLATWSNKLFVTDRGAAAVHIVGTSGQLQTIHAGPPLRRPADLAFASGLLYVVDPSQGRVFQFDPRVERPEPREIALDPRPGPEDAMFLAGASTGVLVSIPALGDIYDVRRPTVVRPTRAEQAPIVKRKDPRFTVQGDGLVDTIQKREFPEISRPGPIATHRGVVYAIDLDTRRIFAFGRHDARPVRVVQSDARGASNLQATALAVTDQWLFALSPEGRVVRMPRVVPAEINLRLGSVSEVMAAFYEYQHGRGILPVRDVPVTHNVERTLRVNRVLLAGYVTQLDALLCRINPGLCGRDGKLRPVHEGETVRVPDIHSENYIDAISVTLKGERLGDVLDRSVQSAEFASFKSEGRLREMNADVYGGKEPAGPLLTRTGGTFTVPVEYVRYIAAIDAADAPPRPGALTALVKRFEGLSIISQEERLAMAYGTSVQPPQEPVEFAKLRKAFERVLKTIEYEPLPDALHLQTVKVGIAEKVFDENHPVFADAASRVWLPPEDVINALNSGGAPPPAFSLREPTELDHGTGVAALIAGRKLAFGGSGLAPKVLVVPLHSSDPAIGDDVRKAYLRGVRLFNISAHYGIDVEPAALRQRIVGYPNALFVVAAGNNVAPDRPLDQQQVCRDFRAYPVCWASEYANLLVVTGTTASGDALVAPLPGDTPTPGTNWSPTNVHVAAPGDGFHAPGAGGAYVPVRGSSFAAPLVTATAALLQAQRIVDPVLIKQRIIATADPVVGLTGRVLAGRLNVRRAIMEPTKGVISRKNTDGTVERVTLLPENASRVTLRTALGQDRVFPLDQIKRLHKHGPAYRVVFINDDGDLRVLSDLTFPTDASARFRCVLENGSVATFDFLDWDDYVGPVGPS